mgnify:CR=1 FL=1
MRVFQIACKDSKTGYEMVLSECSFNMAMYYLDSELVKKHGMEVCSVNTTKDGLQMICFGRWNETESYYEDTIAYYYDEARGYLMKE